jgi:hypothetical protein
MVSYDSLVCPPPFDEVVQVTGQFHALRKLAFARTVNSNAYGSKTDGRVIEIVLLLDLKRAVFVIIHQIIYCSDIQQQTMGYRWNNPPCGTYMTSGSKPRCAGGAPDLRWYRGQTRRAR